MAKYGLYIIGKSKELVTSSYHQSLQKAIEHFCTIKKLPMDVFVTMFQVEKIKENNETRSIKNKF